MQIIERNENFDLAFRFVTETSENIFLTGKAGTGKTTFLKFLRDHAAKNIVVAAPTGVAAINAGGVTLHSLFQLPFHPFLPTRQSRDELLAKIRFTKQRQQLLRKMELLIIDEISMVRCDVMDAIDTILKSVRRNYQAAFGGVQVLFIGDLYQLPPVVQNSEWSILSEYYNSPFFFDSHAIREQPPLLIELDKIYRQKEDGFVELLNKVRNNIMEAEDFDNLHLRYSPGFKAPPGENYITLTSHNNQAGQINQRELNRLLGAPYTYRAEIEKEFPENLYPAEAELVLKEGAQVMFLKNDTAGKRYFNGKIGRVKLLKDDKIVVDCDGDEIDVSKESWENTRYSLNHSDGKLQQETLGRFSQYPLRLAWAITIHKSQGLTFENVMIDAGAAFSSGQVYVALSRCTSLNGIVLLSRIPPAAIYSNDQIVKGQQSLQHGGSLAERFEGARQVFTLTLLEELFSFHEIITASGLLQQQIVSNEDRLNKGAAEWIQHYQQQTDGIARVGVQFLNQVNGLMKLEPIIEKNGQLQKRISDAANHFNPKLNGLLSDLKNHPLITEHKELAADLDESLQRLAIAIHCTHYYLQYCREPFSVAGFLKHKLNLAIPRFNISSYASGKKQAIADTPHPELYETLKRWRDMICDEAGLPIYLVANQATLKEISVYLPMNKKELQLIRGFGKAKAEKYGEDIISAVESYCDLHQVESNMAALVSDPKKQRTEKPNTGKIPSNRVSFNLFREGKTIADIAKERNFTEGTIEGHLAGFVSLGELDIRELVSPEQERLIRLAAETYGSESLTLLKQQLPDDITYHQVRLVLGPTKKDTG